MNSEKELSWNGMDANMEINREKKDKSSRQGLFKKLCEKNKLGRIWTL